MEMEAMNVTGVKAEPIKVRDDGALNLVDVWANRDYDPQFDLKVFFDDKGVERFVRYLEKELEEPVVQVEQEDEELWVHPLVMYRYLAWCEPGVEALCLDLYHQFSQHQAEKRAEKEKDATRH